MSKEPNKIGNNRNPDGTFAEGNPGGGRPKGTLSLVGILKKKLAECPEGNKKTYAELLIDRMTKSAIADGNDQQIKNILQYVEGMPVQKNEITGKEGAKIEISITSEAKSDIPND
jgi:hypothetical protein